MPIVHGLVTTLNDSEEKAKVEFWHPRKGGWYLGTLIKQGKKFATVRAISATRGISVPVGDVRLFAPNPEQLTLGGDDRG